MKDENDRLIEGTLPLDPEADAVPFIPKSARDAAAALERWSVRAAGDRLLALSEKRPPVFMWPGGHSGADVETGSTIPGDVLEAMESKNMPGWASLARTGGPLTADRVVVMVGHTNRGKSAWAVQLAEQAARDGAPVLYMSCEMGTGELAARLVALRAKGDSGAFRNGVPHRGIKNGRADPDGLRLALDGLVADCPALYLWAPARNERTAGNLQQIAANISSAHDNRPPLIIVDYLQRLADGPDRRQAVLDMSGVLRDIARDDGCGIMAKEWPGACVVVLSTVARNKYELVASTENLEKASKGIAPGKNSSVEPSLEGVGKESGEIESDADLLIVLTSDKGETAEPREGLAAIAKNRGGGNSGTVSMEFLPACGRWRETIQGDAGKAARNAQKART